MFITIPSLVLVASIAVTPQQGSAPQDPAPQNPAETITLPVDLDKIQRAVALPPALKQQTGRTVFRVEVFAKKPTIEDILGKDYLIGPVPNSGMTHSEFLGMVTPQQFRGMSAFTGGEALVVAATSLGLRWAVLKAIDKLKDAKTERAKAAARREVMEAMNALEEARKKAGLPPK